MRKLCIALVCASLLSGQQCLYAERDDSSGFKTMVAMIGAVGIPAWFPNYGDQNEKIKWVLAPWRVLFPVSAVLMAYLMCRSRRIAKARRES